MYKKRKYLYALFAFMIAALICIPQTLQMRTQAAASQAQSNCQVSKPLIITRLISSGKRHQAPLITSYITKRLVAISGLK